MTICRVLKCVCNDCGTLLQSKETIQSYGYLQKTGLARLREITNICDKVSCRSKATTPAEELEIEIGPEKACKTNPEFFPATSRTSGHIVYRKSSKDKEDRFMDGKRVFDILNKISDEDARILGWNPPLSHPRNMVLRSLLVVPTNALPPHIGGAQVRPDQLKKVYSKIVSHNQRLKTMLNNPKSSLGGKCECYKEMVSAVKELFIGNQAQKFAVARELMSFAKRLQGKKGIIRRLMMGKRTDYGARTVLGPDADIRFGQVRVPQKIAEEVPLPVRVFDGNKKAVEEWFRNGQVRYIRYPRSGFTEKVKANKTYDIEVGMIVERVLQNGDIVMINRQPTLHKYSMMSYEAVIGKQMTLGMHLSSTSPHNADFDGDEANVQIMIDFIAQAEGKYITNARQCLISDQTNAAVVGLIMDQNTGLFMMTEQNPILDKDMFYHFLDNLIVRDSIPSLFRRALNKAFPENE
jgi:DNA-directed RNA polymerase II subunit RPB1